IGAYRDNEVDSTHPFIMALFELEKANVSINTIELANLQQEDVNHLLQDSLKCESALSQPLTDLIYQKTQGNAFFTHQFLQTLYSDALLRFDFEQYQWQWDVEQIAAQNITANVVELMANKIDKLPSKTSKVLQLATCIGNQFDLSILAIIDEQDKNETLSVLRPALAEGLIQPLDENYKHLDICEKSQFKFLHDRVQQAAYALIDDEHKQAVHLQIGRLLLKNTPADALEDKVFDIVGQFNQSLELLNNKAERLKVVGLNLMAGQKAKASTAYSAALKYLESGLDYLPDDCWQSQYDLALALCEAAAEAASFDAQESDHFTGEVLQHAKSILDKVKVYDIKLQAYILQGKILQAVDTALPFLEQLGICLSKAPKQQEVEQQLHSVKSILAGKDINTLSDLPEMSNPYKLAAMRIMLCVHSAGIIAIPRLASLISMEMVKLSLKYGNAPESGSAYANYGLFLCGEMDDIDSGYQFAKLALKLSSQLSAERFKTRIYVMTYNFVIHWKSHIKNTIEPQLGVYQCGVEAGEREFAAWALHNASYHLFFSSRELPILQQELETYTRAIYKIKQEAALIYNQIFSQAVSNLLEFSETPSRLTGDFYNEEEMLPSHLAANDGVAIAKVYINKLILSYLFEEYHEAHESVGIIEKYLACVTASTIVPVFNFYDSLVQLIVYPKSTKDQRKDILWKVNANQKKMKHWAMHAPMNYQHKYDLVEAEKARVLGQDLVAMDLYEKAIAGAKENEYLNEEALAYELAAKFYLGRGMAKIAQTYLREAHYAYQQWGALAKVNHLENKYPQFLASKTASAMEADATISATKMVSTWTTGGSEWLDLNSLMKAAQTLSGEIVLSRLLEKMMRIVIENAGAETGFLLLNQHDNLFIEAQGHIDSDEVNVLQSLSIETQPIAKTIIHYVERSQEHVVLNHATQEGQFTRDPYIKKQRPKSVLCAPLLNQGHTTGILYLENNLTTGAFTPDRLEVLQVLSSQLAISIENALLYRTLEQKVDERTAQLAEANKEITGLNEQLKEENLRMSAELDVSRRLQQMLLPTEKELEQIDGLDIAGFMEPAEEVGGDYYDVLTNSGRILFAIGDVTGHGLESGALAIMVQSSVRTLLANNETNPVKFFSALNQMVFHNVQRMNVEKSLTLALVDYQQNQLYLSGQHEEMIVVRNGELEL
ncbi:MAG TPA: GAF domain-containing protein, partial [Thiotrichaceae bacterium]|nr:GAF domain-containing protein [Thiotrichaceae bacterium]